ncbi:MAG: hypothetical protein WC639_04840 [Patescibacteria group bacterium]|jgi:hypothetical protein
MSDFQNNNSVAVAARTTANRDAVTLDSYYRWVAEGKVFEAGQSLQSTGLDSQAETALTPDDVKASFALVAPSSSSKIIVPILFKVMFEGDGGAAPDSWLIFTRSSGAMGVSLAVTGTDVNAKNCLYATNPTKAAPQASIVKGVATTFLVTVSALDTANDCVLYHMALMADASCTTAGLGITAKGLYQEYNFIKEGFPRYMTSGAAMIYYVSAASSDAVFHPYIQWAELDPADVL